MSVNDSIGRVKLLADEEAIYEKIHAMVTKYQAEFKESLSFTEESSKKYRAEIQEMGVLAHELHMKLKDRGIEPRHHKYMIKNRELPSDHPDFYKHFHPLEDFVKFVEDQHANDDPKDKTIGEEFSFSVFSKRWGHKDRYGIKRTADGWDIRYMNVGGPCDKGGRPFLFSNLNHDCICHPAGLEGWFEWLWMRAAKDGLSKEDVQRALNDLAEWVSNTEQSSPSGGAWEGY